MKLMQYIKGDRSGENARNVELEVLRDHFLSDAIEGFDRHGPGLELVRDITQMQKSIVSHLFLRRRRWLVCLIVVVVALLVSLAVYMVVFGNDVSGQEPVDSRVAMRGGGESNSVDLYVADTLRSDTLEALQTDRGTILNDTMHSKSIAGQVASSVGREAPVAAPVVSAIDAPIEEDLPPIAASISGNVVLIKVLSSTSVGEGYISTPRIGFRKYDEYINKARVLPDHDKRGDVTISFRVNQYGRPSTMRIESSPSKEANTEAMRLLNVGPEWYPTGDERVLVVISLR